MSSRVVASAGPLVQAGLALSHGVTIFLVAGSVVASPAVAGHTPHVQTLFYVVTFGLFLPLAVALAELQAKSLSRTGAAAVAGANLVAVAALLVAGRALFAVGPDAMRDGFLAGAAAIVLGNALASRALRALPHTEPRLRRLVLIASAALVLGAVSLFVPRSAFSWHQHHASLGLAVLFTLLLVLARQVPRLVVHAVDVVVVLLIAVLALDFNRYGESHAFDQDFYLGPVNAVLHGHAMLVTTFAQYGVGVMYFLAAVFKVIPLGYGGFQLVNGVLRALEFLIVYGILRLGCRRQSFAVLGAAVSLIASILTGIEPTVESASTGPLRFGLPWALVLLAVLRPRLPGRRRLLTASMLGVVALTAVWSFETFVYTVGTFLALTVFEAALADWPWRTRAAQALRGFGAVALAVAASELVFAVVTRAWAGQWPDWGGYFAFIRLYGWNGGSRFFYEPITPWSLGYLIAALYFVSLAALVFIACERRAFAGAERVTLTAIAASTAFGLLAYTYFLGRADPNNLHHISAPAIVLSVLWLGLLTRNLPAERTATRLGLLACAGWAAAALVGQIEHPTAIFHGFRPVASSRTALKLAPIRQLVVQKPDDPRVVEAAKLLDELSPRGSRAAVVLDGGSQTAVLIRADRGNLLPITNPFQDALLPAQSLALVDSALGELKPGTVVLTEQNYLRLQAADAATVAAQFGSGTPGRLETAILSKILHRFRYSIAARTRSGLIAVRLGARRD